MDLHVKLYKLLQDHLEQNLREYGFPLYSDQFLLWLTNDIIELFIKMYIKELKKEIVEGAS